MASVQPVYWKQLTTMRSPAVLLVVLLVGVACAIPAPGRLSPGGRRGQEPQPDADSGSRRAQQFTGLTPEQLDKFRENVEIEDVDGIPHYKFRSDGLPDDDIQAEFPGFGNPNAVRPQNWNLEIPRQPRPRDPNNPGCLPMGPIGMTVEGFVFYNPYTIEQEDAVEVEIMGKCNGHPSPDGAYHHHAVNNCTYSDTADELLGVAFDGIPILGPKDSTGKILTTNDLDQCHGKFDDDGFYRYRITSDFPYILGCFRGDARNVDQSRPNCSIPGTPSAYMARLMAAVQRVETAFEDEDREGGRMGLRIRQAHQKLKRILQEGYMRNGGQ